MEREFDVQRDHVWLLQAAGELLESGGAIVFSNNFQRFRLDAEGLADFDVRGPHAGDDAGGLQAQPEIHVCYLLRPKVARLAGG